MVKEATTVRRRVLKNTICVLVISAMLCGCGKETQTPAAADGAETESTVQEQQPQDDPKETNDGEDTDSQKSADDQTETKDRTGTTDRDDTVDDADTSEASADSNNTDTAPDYASFYAPVLSETLEVINEGYDYENDYKYLSDGLMEKVMYDDRSSLFRSIGYVIEDIDGDGIPELMIGYDDQDYDTLAEQSYILGVYALDGKEPYSVLYGWARNTYRWLGNGHVLNLGSGGAAVTILADSHFDHSEKRFICDDFYFSDEKEAGKIAYFHNTTGVFDMDLSEELSISSDGFWELIEGYEKDCKLLDWTPIGSYVIADAYHEDGSPVHDDSAMYLYADYCREPTQDKWNAFIGKAPENAVLFIITNPPEELNDLVKAPVEIDGMTQDMIIAVALADDTKIDLESGEVAFSDAGGILWNPGSDGKLYKTYLDKGEASCMKITLPEGIPGRCLNISAPAGNGMFLVATLSGEWNQHSEFITS